jgi:uncharacterized membrane protein
LELDGDMVDKAVEAAAKTAAEEARENPAAVEDSVRTQLRRAMHRHPRELTAEHTMTFGERAAGFVARTSGSWRTILPYLILTVIYLAVNHWVFTFDRTLQYYTFAVSVLAIFLAQVILLFQNRQSDLESDLAHNAYEQTAEIFTMQLQQVKLLEAIHTLTQRNEQVLETLDDMMIDVHTIIHRLGATSATVEPSETSEDGETFTPP